MVGMFHELGVAENQVWRHIQGNSVSASRYGEDIWDLGAKEAYRAGER